MSALNKTADVSGSLSGVGGAIFY